MRYKLTNIEYADPPNNSNVEDIRPTSLYIETDVDLTKYDQEAIDKIHMAHPNIDGAEITREPDATHFFGLIEKLIEEQRIVFQGKAQITLMAAFHLAHVNGLMDKLYTAFERLVARDEVLLLTADGSWAQYSFAVEFHAAEPVCEGSRFMRQKAPGSLPYMYGGLIYSHHSRDWTMHT
jgi:hypothetical protein